VDRGREADRSIVQWQRRVQPAAGGARREFVYQWSAPRSPVARVLLAPVLILAALLAFVVGALVLALFLLLTLAAIVVFALLALVSSVGRPKRPN
jgi:Flp pilus assembly protein TadB